MDLVELKQYIVDNDKIPNILEWLGCNKIRAYKKEYRCALPNHSNSSAVSVKRTSLSARIYSAEKELKGDVITLAMELNGTSFLGAVKGISELLGLKFKSKVKTETKTTLMDSFKPFIQKNICNIEDIEDCPSSIMDSFEEISYIGWVREGIMPYTQKEFGIGYSVRYDRVCIPWRRWNGARNEYLGVVGRTLNPDYKLLDIPKYFPLHPFLKSVALYGLQENYKYIQEAGQVIVFEAEKSVLKAHSLLIKNCVALGGHELSMEQISILLSLNVEIIFALDKDMDEELSKAMCDRVKHHRKAGYIVDEYGLIGKKDSPIDKGIKIWKVLFKRIKYIE